MPMPVHGRRVAVPLALAAAVLTASCGSRDADPFGSVHDLGGVPGSPLLASAIAAERAAFATDVPRTEARRTLVACDALLPRIDRPDDRAAAAAELEARLARETGVLLWHLVARFNRNLLAPHLDYAEMLDRAAEAGGLAAAFSAALYEPNRNRRLELYLALDADAADGVLDRYAILNRQARARWQQGDAVGAVRPLLELLPAARTQAGPRLAARIWEDVARVLQQDDRLDGALHARCAAVALWGRAREEYRGLQARLALAELLDRRSERGAAAVLLAECLAGARALDHPWLEMEVLNETAAHHAETGDLERALACDRESYALARALGDSLNAPMALANVAHDLRQLGRLDECRAVLDEGRRWVAAYPHPALVAGFPQREVPYYLHVGDYATADSLLRAAMGAVPEAVLAVEEATFHLEMIGHALEMGRTDLAYAALARLEELRHLLYDRLADSNRAAEYALAKADLLAQQGEYVRATAALDDAEAAIARGGGEGMAWSLARARGDLALLRDDPVTARAAFAACLDLARAGHEPALVADSRVRLGITLLELGRAAEARALLADTTRIDELGPRFRARLAARLYAAVALARTGAHAPARRELTALVAATSRHAPADLLARAHLELGRLCSDLDASDAAAAHLDTAAAVLASAGAASHESGLRVPHRDLRRELVETMVGFHLDRADAADDTALARRTLAMTALAGVDPPPADLPGPRLTYFVGRERSFRWCGRDGRLRVSTLPGRDSLRTLVVPVVADVERPDHTPDRAAAVRLAGILWDGLPAAWRPGETLRLDPDGVLQAVPWAALPFPPRDGAPPALEHGAICEWAGAGAARPAATGSVLVIGDDRPLGGTGGELRHAEREAAAVAALWPADRVTLRLGARADHLAPEDLADHAVVHIASHARFSEGLPSRATLRFAAAGSPLTAGGIAHRELRADLIYLSCCEAARPLAVGGLGSFARACLTAGASTVIASGMRVDDTAAAALAVRFYRHWQRGRTKADALRAAQLELRAERPEWSHPYYWATYRLIGASR